MSFTYSNTQLRKKAVEQADSTGDPGLRLAEVMRDVSKKLEDGSPSVYKLHMNEVMRNPEDMIARQSLGTHRRIGLGETEKVFMVVGATGAGKTTLINSMVNYILGVQWEDEFRFKAITGETKAGQAYSQTQGITAYTFYPMKGSAVSYTFTVIDTPGYGGTGGVQRDKEITKQIKKFFSLPPPHGIDHLDGVGFVVQASQARLTPVQEYIFDSILAIFGNDVSKHIFFMITFAVSKHLPVLEAIKEAKIPSPSEKQFKFNNSTFFAEKDAEESETFLDELFWEKCLRSFSKFFEEFLKTESVSLTLTREVLEEREQLLVSIEGLKEQITLSLDKREEIKQEKIVMQQHEKDIETNKDFTYTVDIPKPVHLKGTGHHTICETCNSTCHTNCKVDDDALKYGCWAMNKRGNCRICPGKCNWLKHKNRPYQIKYETITEKRTAKDLKKKYFKAVQQKATCEQMLKAIEESLKAIHYQVIDMIKRAQQSLRRLDEIALKPNPVTPVDYLELLIESEKMETKSGWKHRIQYLEAAKRHAEILSKVKDEKEMQDLMEKLAKVGDVSDEKLEERFFGGDN